MFSGSSIWSWTAQGGAQLEAEEGDAFRFGSMAAFNGSIALLAAATANTAVALHVFDPTMRTFASLNTDVKSVWGMVEMGGALYMSTTLDFSVGTELYRVLPSGTAELVHDVNTAQSSSGLPQDLTLSGGDTLYYHVNRGPNNNHDKELWAYSTSAGPQMAALLATGSQDVVSEMTILGRTAYVVLSKQGVESFHSLDLDNTGAGTSELSPAVVGTQVEGLLVDGSRLLYTAVDSSGDANVRRVFELSNSSSAAPLAGNTSGWSVESCFAVHDDTLLVIADDGLHGKELAEFGPSATTLVRDIHAGTRGADISDITVLGDKIYFGANDGIHGNELWCANASLSVWMLNDTIPGSGGLSPTQLGSYNGSVFFRGVTDETGSELWEYNTETGEQALVADLRPGQIGSGVTGPCEFDGELFFGASHDRFSAQLWAYNRTAGPYRVADVYGGTAVSFPQHMLVFDSTLFFANIHGLYTFTKADGVQQVVAGGSEPIVTGIQALAVHNGTLFIVGQEDSSDPPLLASLNTDTWAVVQYGSLDASTAGGAMSFGDWLVITGVSDSGLGGFAAPDWSSVVLVDEALSMPFDYAQHMAVLDGVLFVSAYAEGFDKEIMHIVFFVAERIAVRVAQRIAVRVAQRVAVRVAQHIAVRVAERIAVRAAQHIVFFVFKRDSQYQRNNIAERLGIVERSRHTAAVDFAHGYPFAVDRIKCFVHSHCLADE
ncbi:hypothetical protein FNF28_02530 [Cafeteria roenbergensis]|uniref:Uncharacterized protein n=1 Tax=Cafeteria roenbergensis TaxID=33653 RepID=A0A5A8DX12_CAFRO|nr:hypothetical protein FNF28_02530 [Cafeteria roenbergensis]